MISSQAGADATKTWKVVSPSIVSVLPTWPGYTKPGFGAPVGAAPEGTGIAISKDGYILTAANVIAKARTIEIRDGNNNLATGKQRATSNGPSSHLCCWVILCDKCDAPLSATLSRLRC